MTPQVRDCLLPFQEVGADFLARRRYAGLFDEMGLGKTPESIVAANRGRCRHNLVIAPHIGLINWQREIEKWSDHPTSTILTNKAPKASTAWEITNFEMFSDPGAVMAQVKQRRYDLIIIDESQCLKNQDSKRTWNIYGRHGVARQAERLWALSGTPAPNHPGELYTLLVACCPDAIPVAPAEDFAGRKKRYMSYQEFLDRYTRMVTTRGGFEKIVGGRNLQELRDRMSGFSIRRTMRQVLPEMPPVRCSQLAFAPGEGLGLLSETEEAAELRIALQAAIARLLDANSLLSEDEALLEALNYMETEWTATVRRLYGEALAPMVAEHLKFELENGLEKIVVFYHHRNVGNYLDNALHPWGALKVDGGTALALRQRHIDQFQNDPTKRVFLAQIDVAHRVITLTAAAQVLFAEASWVPGINFQAIRRCARFGQTKTVLARFAVLAGSLHEVIMRTMIRKARTLAELWNEVDDFEMGDTEHATFAS